MRNAFIALATILFVSTSAQGATWYVAKDGSGDFSVIQDAVDAASDGDIIEVGPGRYDEYHPLNNFVDVFVEVQDKSLTINGSGADETIIGPEDPESLERDSEGIIAHGSQLFSLHNLTIENMRWGGSMDASVQVFEVSSCIFRNGEVPWGLTVDCAQGGFIRDCRFEGHYFALGVFSPTEGLLIEDCDFSGFRIGMNVGWAGTSCTARNCTFDGQWRNLSTGAYVSGAAQLTLEGCSFSSCSRFGVAVADCAPSEIRDCVIEQIGGGSGGVRLMSGYQVLMENNLVISDTYCFAVQGSGQPGGSVFRNNHILRQGDGWYVADWYGGYQHPGEVLNMEGNYWGIQDPEEIATWILDGNDDPEIGFVVDFLPMADGPVSTERVTLDGIKALYR